MRWNRVTFVFASALLGVLVLTNDVCAGVVVGSYAGARAIREYTGPGQQIFVSEDQENRLGFPALTNELSVPFLDNLAQARGTPISNQVRARASVNPLGYQAFYPGTFAQSDATASTTLTETITLVGNSADVENALLNNGPLYARAQLSGEIFFAPDRVFDGGPGGDDDLWGISALWFYDAQLQTGIDFDQATDNELIYQFGLSFSEIGTVTSISGLNQNLSAELDFQFDGDNWTANYTRVLTAQAAVVTGVVDVNLMNSFGLTGVTFADGTTPEELGFSLQFGTGRTSPNSGTVPEPCSVAIFGLLGLVVGSRRVTRRTSEATR